MYGTYEKHICYMYGYVVYMLHSPNFRYITYILKYVSICGIAGENRPTGAKLPMEIIDL